MNLNETTILIDRGRRLKEVLDAIPTNTVLNKTVCGVGATWLEIHSERNSIIIEPNVPVIEGKAKDHPELLGVKEGVLAEDIQRYVQTRNDRGGYIKLMTTPESFPKVRKALADLSINYRKDFPHRRETGAGCGFRGMAKENSRKFSAVFR